MGALEAILHNGFREDAQELNYGQNPWYRQPGKEKFPDGLCLITRQKRVSFDIRSDGTFFHIVSDLLLDCVYKTGGTLEDCKKIEIRSREGKLVASNYNVCRFQSHPVDEVCDPEATLLTRTGSRIVPKHIEIRDDFPAPIFKIQNLSAKFDFVFCNEKFKTVAENAKLCGVAFESTRMSLWHSSAEYGTDYLAMALGKTPVILPV